MDGKQRVKLIKECLDEYRIEEEKLIQLMMVVKNENQFKRCIGMLLEDFSIKEVVDMVIYNKI